MAVKSISPSTSLEHIAVNNRTWGGHVLRRNAANQRPSMFVFVHCETTEEKINDVKPYIRHKLHTGVAVAVEWRRGRAMREKWFTFQNADLFWAWLPEWQRKSRVCWVAMHDAFRTLTILNLWELMEGSLYQTWKPGHNYKDPRTGKIRKSEPWNGMKAIDGKPFHLETEGPRGRCNFTDVRNYYPTTLTEICESVGIRYKLNVLDESEDTLIECKCSAHVDTKTCCLIRFHAED